MTPKALKAIEKHFGKVTDPRVERTKDHKFSKSQSPVLFF
jgi:hypothetical protein